MIETNPKMRVDVFTVGNEKTPVVVVDDVLTDTSVLRRYAIESVAFTEDQQTAYPGIRAPLPRLYTNIILQALSNVLRETYRLDGALRPNPAMEYFSLLTTQPDELHRLQRVPHFDTTDDNFVAMVHYMNPGDFGGTGFFRHRPTGFERIRQSRVGRYSESAMEFVQRHGEPEPAYIRGTTEHFELMRQVDYRPNRLIAYPGNLLHSGLVDPAVDLSDSPTSGRLTSNLFIQYS